MKQFNLILIAILICLSSCKLSNIYSDSSKNDNSEDVHSLLLKTTNAYGGIKNWGNVKNVRAVLQDDWSTFHWKLLASPWKEQITHLNFDWKPNSNNVRINILTGKNKGIISGIQNWASYSIQDTTVIFKKNKEMKFHLTTMEYLFEFPFRIQAATQLKSGGTKELDGVLYKTILMSWNTFEPQKNIDQYLIYINPETSLIDYLEFTVRDQGKFTYATVHFENFKQVETFIFPHKITAYFQNNAPGKTIGHQMTIDSLILNNEFPINYFVPNPSVVDNK